MLLLTVLLELSELDVDGVLGELTELMDVLESELGVDSELGLERLLDVDSELGLDGLLAELIDVLESELGLDSLLIEVLL